MFIFPLSVILATTTIILVCRKLQLQRIRAFFVFFPLLILYLEGISFFLSCAQTLTLQSFFTAQIIILFIVGIFIFSLPPHNERETRNKDELTFSRMPIILWIPLIYSVLLIVLSGILRWHTPTLSYDDVSYRATAPMQWIQQRSIFRSDTISEHGNVFLYGTGILYLWPFLFHANEQVATLLYWTSFPILCIQLVILTYRFTKRRDTAIFVLLVYTTAPIVFRHVSLILIQELWVGVVLLSNIYLLYTVFTQKDTTLDILFLTGISFGILPQLKLTGALYIGFLFLFTQKRFQKNILYILIAFITSLLISGYPIIVYQNFLLYGSPGGTAAFRSIHIASLSFMQCLTNLIRIPFMFFKLPCYTTECQGLDKIMQPLSVLVGATHTLPKELSEAWIGTFKYSSADPDKNFGYGGILWILLLALSIKMAMKGLQKKSLSTTQTLTIVFSFIIFFLICVTRWEDASGVPYKHLISAFPLACLLAMQLFQRTSKKLLVGGIFVVMISSMPLVPQTVKEIQLWRRGELRQVTDMIRVDQNPYEKFLHTLTSPSNILVIGETGIPNYPLYISNGKKMHSVYPWYPQEQQMENPDTFLINMITTLSIRYIILPVNHPFNTVVMKYNEFELVTTTSFEDAEVNIFRYNIK